MASANPAATSKVPTGDNGTGSGTPAAAQGIRLVGDEADNRLDGTTRNDALNGGSGNDRLFGGAGNDKLDGGSGNDSLDGGSGNDSLHGGSGSDSLYGGSGNDNLHGDSGNDYLQGDSGNDGLFGGSGNDQLLGGTGNDSLYGGTGNDSLYGGDGNDQLTGNGGSDWLYGGDGNDVFRDSSETIKPSSAQASRNEMFGGAGDDIFHLDLAGQSVDHVHGGEGAGDTLVLHAPPTLTNSWVIVLNDGRSISLADYASGKAELPAGALSGVIENASTGRTIDFDGIEKIQITGFNTVESALVAPSANATTDATDTAAIEASAATGAASAGSAASAGIDVPGAAGRSGGAGSAYGGAAADAGAGSGLYGGSGGGAGAGAGGGGGSAGGAGGGGFAGAGAGAGGAGGSQGGAGGSATGDPHSGHDTAGAGVSGMIAQYQLQGTQSYESGDYSHGYRSSSNSFVWSQGNLNYPYSGRDGDHRDALAHDATENQGGAGNDLFGVEMRNMPAQPVDGGSGGFDTLELRGSDPSATWTIVADGKTTTVTAGEAAGAVVASGPDMTGYVCSSFNPDARVYFSNIDEIKVA